MWKLFWFVVCLGFFGCARNEQIRPQVQSPGELCNLGDGKACLQLAVNASKEASLSPRRLIRLSERACELREAKGCVLAAQAQSKTVEGIRVKIRFFEEACRLNLRDGCVLAAQTNFLNAEHHKEQLRASTRLKKLCLTDAISACLPAVRAYLSLGKTPPAMAVSQLIRVCKQNWQDESLECDRVYNYSCLAGHEECAPTKHGDQDAYVEACPAVDSEWVASRFYVASGRCRQTDIRSGTYKFRFDGHQLESVGERRSCLETRLRAMRILPLNYARHCTIKLRF